MRSRTRPPSVLARVFTGYLLLYLLLLPFTHDHHDVAAARSDDVRPALHEPVPSAEHNASECLACLFLTQVRTGLTPTTPSLAFFVCGPEQPWSTTASWPLLHVASPVLPRGPPTV